MADSMPQFIHLRLHSAYSLLEGAIRIKELPKLCRKEGMPAVALTDTANLFGALEFSEVMAEAGIQPITGCTLPVRLDEPEEPSRGPLRREPAGSLALLVKDERGYENLMKLSSLAFLEPESGEAAQGVDQQGDHAVGMPGSCAASSLLAEHTSSNFFRPWSIRR